MSNIGQDLVNMQFKRRTKASKNNLLKEIKLYREKVKCPLNTLAIRLQLQYL